MKTILYTFVVFLVTVVGYAQQIHRELIYSPKMNTKIKTIIITPQLESGHTYKTVYILHGYSGNPERTLQKDIPNLMELSQQFQTIYVIPNGRYNSWYVDSPIDKSSQYETFIGEELVQYIDSKYPTISSSQYRAICGWSMGGYGALHIGINHPNNFAFVGSSCGALDFNRFGENYSNYQVDKVLGPFKNLHKTYFTINKITQMQQAQQLYILDCGTEDTQMIEMNREFHQQLITNKVQHLYIESLGAHDANYWSQSMSNQLALFDKYWKL